MTLEQLTKFCNGHQGITKEPFGIDKWRVATDGVVLIAENGLSPIKLPELEACNNRDYILKMLSVEIPDQLYSFEHLNGFLSGEETELVHPVFFNGHAIDKSRLRKVFSVCIERYRFAVSNQGCYHCFHFSFGKVTALVMGMRDIVSAIRYEPIKYPLVSQ